jgi:putative phosphoesterase
MKEEEISRFGVISDTHGLLRREAVEALRGCMHIIHGGDIGASEILETLSGIAPVTAIRGNNDTAPWAARLNETEILDLHGVRVCVIHDVSQLRIDLADQRIRVVVSGHSHKPRIDRRDGVLFVNPGSAGPRRFKLPVAVAIVTVTRAGTDAALAARIVELAAA